MASENKKVEVVPNLSSIPGSRKVYVQGSREDIQVPMREITLTPTAVGGTEQENPPVRVYDSSGPYTDSSYSADVRKGLPRNRLNWILQRGDAEAYAGRAVKPEDNGYKQGQPDSPERFPGLERQPLRAKPGAT